MPQKDNVSNYIEHTSSLYIDSTAVSICVWVVYTALCQALNIFGIVTNSINIVCFAKQGFQDSITVSLFGLSLADLFSLITMAWSCISMTPAFITADLPFDSVEIAYVVSAVPHFAFTRVSFCITAMITLERCLSVITPLKVKSIITPRRAGAAVICLFVIFVLSPAPTYVVNRISTKFSPLRNKSIVGVTFTHNREKVEQIAITVNNFLIPVCAFLVVSISTVILSIQLNNKIKWRKRTISDGQADRISTRNKQVAKMVVTISTLFISCYTPIVITMMLVAFVPGLSLMGKYLDITIIIAGFTYTFESVNSSLNIFIYHKMSTKYRDTLRILFIRTSKKYDTP